MRLFKFLVIHNDLINNTDIFMPVIRTRKKANNKNQASSIYSETSSIINTKNKLYLYRYDKSRKTIASESLDIIDNSDKAIALMSIDYPNEGTNFAKENKAYVIINANDCEEVMKLISSQGQSKDNHFSGCNINVCKDCMELSKPCRNKNINIDIPHDKIYIRGKTWSFTNDTAGTKNTITENINGLIINRTIEPKTGGIAYSSIQWENGNRPVNLAEKTVYVSLHHWIKCNSIPKKALANNDYSFYHIGHTFDCRYEFIGLATKKEQENLRKNEEPQNDIRRGRRVLAGQRYFSRTLECDCGLSENNPKCRDCAGVLYIDTEQGLVDLYNQLISDEYRQLREGKTI